MWELLGAWGCLIPSWGWVDGFRDDEDDDCQNNTHTQPFCGLLGFCPELYE